MAREPAHFVSGAVSALLWLNREITHEGAQAVARLLGLPGSPDGQNSALL